MLACMLACRRVLYVVCAEAAAALVLCHGEGLHARKLFVRAMHVTAPGRASPQVLARPAHVRRRARARCRLERRAALTLPVPLCWCPPVCVCARAAWQAGAGERREARGAVAAGGLLPGGRPHAGRGLQAGGSQEGRRRRRRPRRCQAGCRRCCSSCCWCWRGQQPAGLTRGSLLFVRLTGRARWARC